MGGRESIGRWSRSRKQQPNVNANALTPASMKSIANVRSTIGSPVGPVDTAAVPHRSHCRPRRRRDRERRPVVRRRSSHGTVLRPWSVTAPRRDARHAQYRICPRDLIHGRRLRWSVTEDPSAFALPPSRFALRRTRRDTTLVSQGRKSFTAQFRRLSRAAARKRPRQPAIPIRPQENSASE